MKESEILVFMRVPNRSPLYTDKKKVLFSNRKDSFYKRFVLTSFYRSNTFLIHFYGYRFMILALDKYKFGLIYGVVSLPRHKMESIAPRVVGSRAVYYCMFFILLDFLNHPSKQASFAKAPR